MASLNGIKLIIWDLDDTLWHGTLSEETVSIKPDVREFIELSLDAGIVHSICSKNDYDKTKAELEKLDLWDKFVFPSIDWTPKGRRIRDIISSMSLRATNVLFLDDNIQNLEEAKYYCKDLKTELPDCVNELLGEVRIIEKTDKQHKRLSQYRVLEEKQTARQSFSTNEEFLLSSNIQVKIQHDCLNHVDRLHELLMRSNQLNYTKFRQPKEDLIDLLKEDNVNSGYVSVNDRFGDYGIVGFYVIKEGRAIHYLFSCRTLGMLVEQWVYKEIGCPTIDVRGEVVTQLNDTDYPEWINQGISSKDGGRANLNHQVLLKGPCDLLQIFTFINETDNITTEFTYTNDHGVVIEGINHTSQIITALETSTENKHKVLDSLPWSDSGMLETSWKSGNYDIIFLSMVTDASMGLYRHKETGAIIALCEKYYDITKKENWNDLIKGNIWNEDIPFTLENLSDFSEKYEFVNNDDFRLTIDNVDFLYNSLNRNTKLVLLLGAETPFEKEKRPAYEQRDKDHKRLNCLIREWAKDKEKVTVYEMDEFITGQKDFVDSINHFTKKVYYELAERIVADLKGLDVSGISVKKHSKVYTEEIKAMAKRIARRAIGKK